MKQIFFIFALFLFAGCSPYKGQSVDPSLPVQPGQSLIYASLDYYEQGVQKITFFLNEPGDRKKYPLIIEIGKNNTSYLHTVVPPGSYILSEWEIYGRRDNRDLRARGNFRDFSRTIFQAEAASMLYLGRVLVSQVGSKVYLTLEDRIVDDFAYFKKQWPYAPWLEGIIKAPFSLQNPEVVLGKISDSDMQQSTSTAEELPFSPPPDDLPFAPPD